MSDLKIKAESLPARCEICHQNDLFDPINNSCSRCNQVVIKPIKSTKSIFQQSFDIPDTVINKLEKANLIFSLLAGTSLFLFFAIKYSFGSMEESLWETIIIGVMLWFLEVLFFLVIGLIGIGFISIAYPLVMFLIRAIKWCWYKLRAVHYRISRPARQID